MRPVPGRVGGRGQTTLEFALMAPLFLLCLLATVDAALWAIQSSATVSAAEQGARIAAAAAGDPRSELTPATQQVMRGIGDRLSAAMFATSVRGWCPPDDPGCSRPVGACPADPQAVHDRYGPRTIAVCVLERTPGCAPTPCVSREGPNVTVRLVGYAASLVPPVFGLGWRAGEIPVDVHVRTHAVRFNP